MDKLIYTKYSTDRDKNFAIRTDRLLSDNGGEIINKVALCDEGVKHLEHMVNMSKKLSNRFGDKIRISGSALNGRVLTNEFVEGKSYFKIFEEVIEEGDKEAVMKTLDDYRDRIYYSTSEDKAFTSTREFEEVFGSFDALDDMNLMSSDVTDIDMILENIIVASDGTWQLIDYEWTFDFPIPREYVLYRTLVYLYNSSKISYVMKFNKALKWAGITEEQEKIYKRMEKNFQTYITKGKQTIEDFINESDIRFIPLIELLEAKNRLKVVSGEYDKAMNRIGELTTEHEHYVEMAKRNEAEFSNLRNEYVLTQLEMDKYRDDIRQMEAKRQREANKHGLKRFFK